ncbi:hypothetical protein GCM10028807_14180 [Spirosoma daeguense]
MEMQLELIPSTAIRTWGILLLSWLIIASCKSGSDNPLTPQADSVQISNRAYSIQSIGNQIWTTVNYSGQGGVAYGTKSEKPEYGRYYTFEEVKAIKLPTGWRIPTMQDYIVLAQNQGIVLENNRATRQDAIQKLLSTTSWRTKAGSNASGFNAYPTGYCFRDAPPQDGDLAEFWLADGKTVSIQEVAGSTHNLSFYGDSNNSLNRFTVRFVKNH